MWTSILLISSVLWIHKAMEGWHVCFQSKGLQDLVEEMSDQLFLVSLIGDIREVEQKKVIILRSVVDGSQDIKIPYVFPLQQGINLLFFFPFEVLAVASPCIRYYLGGSMWAVAGTTCRRPSHVSPSYLCAYVLCCGGEGE